MYIPSLFAEMNPIVRRENEIERRSEKAAKSIAGVMKTDIKETDDGYVVKMDLPGCKKEDITLELKNGQLSISAKQNVENEEKDENGKYIRRERFSGSVSRAFYVGEDVTQEDIKAKFEDGILSVTVPKKEKAEKIEKSDYIAIE